MPGWNYGDVPPFDALGYADDLLETFPARTLSADYESYQSGNVRVGYLYAYKNFTANTLGVVTGFSNSSVSASTRLGIYTVDRDQSGPNDNLTLAARTALTTGAYGTGFALNDITLASAVGPPAYPATYTFIKGQRYALGVYVGFSGVGPQLRARTNMNPVALSQLSPRLGATLWSQSDLPTTITASSLSASGAAPFNLPYIYGRYV